MTENENILNDAEDQNIQDSTAKILKEDMQDNEEQNVTELLKQQVQEEKDKFLRLFAEFENYKRRTQKERSDLFRTANREVLEAMLPVCDDFERALEQIQKIDNIDPAIVEGIQLIQHKLYATLESKGLKKMETLSGDDFNTDFHEAITQIPAPSEEMKGKIVDVIETGYTLNDKVIRYAKVVVGN